MYLKKLQLHGFKTFANKTEFFYDSGITAIVGPNGSGKSNIADAVRWVLGEQRYSLMRGKKTEDVIFAGSSGRPGMGFAEASITFDNTERKLPIDFSEVIITRRAYRTGENEYYINKARVRLKDIHEVVNQISSNYTVITQGMVDAALSQKPEERRSLFEDAAAIGHYNTRRIEAEERLNKTQENMRRISDLLAEIGPRMKGMEKHARLAEEYYALQEELQTLFRRWYGYRWRGTNRTLVAAKRTEQQAQSELEKCNLDMESLKLQSNAARTRQNELRVKLAGLHQDSSTLHTRAQQLQQQVAVEREKLNGLSRQRDSHQQELVSLRMLAEENTRRYANLELEFKAVKSEISEADTKVATQETALKEKTLGTSRIETAWAQKRDEVLKILNRLDSLQQQTAQQVKRREELARQQAHYYEVRDNTLARQKELQQEIDVARNSLNAFEKEVNALTVRRKSEEVELNSTTEAIRLKERQAQDLRNNLDSTRSRLNLLQDLQNSFAGLHSGVKAVMQATKRNKNPLGGILGLAANLLEAPVELELAIETALGGHLQDIVVDRWADAEDAIRFLKEGGQGRATFLPLDSLKSQNSGRLEDRIFRTEGVRGLATGLIRFAEKYRSVYEQLLGRWLVVDDLKVARRILPDLPIGWNAVTLGGETVRGGGAVTGGTLGRERAESGMLMRERELRELPVKLAALEKQIAEGAQELSKLQVQLSTRKQQIANTERETRQMNDTLQKAQGKLSNLSGQAERLAHELKVREETSQNLARESAVLDEQETTINTGKETALKQREQTQAEVASLEKSLHSAKEAEQKERDKLTALRTANALFEQRIKSAESNLQFARTERDRVIGQVKAREEQIKELENQNNALQHSLETAQGELAKLSEQLEALRAEIAPYERQLEALELEQVQSDKRWREMSTHMLQLEASHSRATLEVQRLEAELETLQVQANADLAPSMVGEQGEQAQVNPADWIELLELGEDEARQLHERIEQSRVRLRRIGVVNPLAMQEYNETSTRHSFLSRQLEDLEEATRSLRELIKELNQLTQLRFSETFTKVAEAFSKYFAQLFNGGSAKLFLTTPDNLADTGIEIVAQPPGKKQQNLVLLSGGERALTAVALLFALLEVNPTPFCILDEVDAALDEANVRRFCETLKVLAARTQFIVVTHNRGTIEAARTIYGISMGSDSVSKTISLRIDEVSKFRQKYDKSLRSAETTTDPSLISKN
ncbi:MAG: chromosome segregation protein SMC [Chloroflexi bacterium]|uniref:Chromosome partition protein Smc n=1 Tax=Candidatus Chlorohelix allophototropha TaxID=3003348 RepID=A0A8T7M1Y9_9CHLR|nr:chromosome segregation protein SMC [Chloroflexota bacterium]WJW65670.1 chromosome segregation protein SMC [Chloroflexota bacterium L227-S17]